MSATPQQIAERSVAYMLEHDEFSRWLGLELLEIAPGTCRCRMTVRQEMVNGFGVSHGGIVFSFADSVFAFASNSYGTVSVAIDNTIRYPDAIRPGDVLTAVGVERAASNRIGYYDVTVTNGDGVTVALFKGTVYRTKKPLPIAEEN